jgi:leucyl aminopeptidase
LPTFRPGPVSDIDLPANLLVVAATEGNVLTPPAAAVDSAMDATLAIHLATARSLGSSSSKKFEGEVGDVTIIPTAGRIGAAAVMVVGLGPKDKVTHEQVRRAAGVAARNAGEFPEVILDISQEVPHGAQAAIEGFELGSYRFDVYMSKRSKAAEMVIVAGAEENDIRRGGIYTSATMWARDLVNEPPSNRGPAVVAALAAELAYGAGLTAEIWDEKALVENSMNGILTVGRGSDSPPHFAVLTYDPPGAQGSLGLVGKGITFDSGGLSIKTSEGMETMKMDCSGAAAVIAAVCALPALGPKIKVTAAVALAENMPGGRAAKPGDVIRHFGGKTSEVLNTDAEGRLVLADALAWMSTQQPDAMVDIATLTGGMMVALGTKWAGVLSNERELVWELLEASDRTGEPLWEMPLIDEYRSSMVSTVADIKNITGSRYGSPIIGGLFLKDFVGDTPWAHLDIAGPAWEEKGEHYLPAGATGYGTRLLLDWVQARAAKE